MVRKPLVVLVVVAVALGGLPAGLAAATGDAGQMQHTSVTFSDQNSGGQTVTVDEVTLSEGGFVTIHASSLQDGEALRSVVGTSTYLEAGTHENVTVRLSEPVSEDETLVAMAHRDDGDRTYEFVSTGGNADGPYTADGGAVVDAANVTVSATVSASDQPTTGDSVVVDRVELSEPGFVVIHDGQQLADGQVVESVAGVSEKLSAGVHTNVRVELTENVSDTVVAMPHMDTNDNDAYDFPDADGPFTADGGAVTDAAELTRPTDASVSFDAEASGGTVVTVESVFVPEGGFVVLHDERLADGEAVESVRGASEYLSPGLHRDVEVTLEEPLSEDETLTAMAHQDTNDDQAYEFPDADGPYTADGGAVVDDGDVTVSASVSLSTQESDGNTVVVEDVDLSEGGFVVIHDSSLFAGEVAGSVLGASEYLEAGHHERVELTLSEPANESQVLVAMAHRDTDGNEAYDFPEADGPYTADGGAVVDTGKALVTASVSVADQSGGDTVIVDSVTLANGGFVTVHDGTVTEGQVFESIRGTSTYLPPGTHENVEIELDDSYEGDGTIVTMAHQDTDGDETYTFVESEGAADGPYVAAGGAVVNVGAVSVETPTATATPTETSTEMGTEMEPETETTSSDGPGFGAVVAVVALLAAALIAVRRP
ncbi:MAG: PGF-CTERM sorting domain-containing protein [Halolamina sp.]